MVRTRRAARSACRPDMRAAALIFAGLLLLVLCGWGVSRWLGARSHPPQSSAAVLSPSESPVDLVDLASIALQDCARGVPPSIPDGASASREQMAAARSAFQAYDTATNSYARCVDGAIDRVARQYAGVASPGEIKALKAFGLGAHDTAIDLEQSIADRLNLQIRAYKAKHPQP